MKTKPKPLTIGAIVAGVMTILGAYWAFEDRFVTKKEFDQNIQIQEITDKAQDKKIRKNELKTRLYALHNMKTTLNEQLKANGDPETRRRYDEVLAEIHRVRDQIDRLEGE